jgi:hypothetical protein
MASLVGGINALIETADALKAVRLSFEKDLREALKAELMTLAEARIDQLVDDTVKALETKINAARELYAQQVVVRLTVNRQAP